MYLLFDNKGQIYILYGGNNIHHLIHVLEQVYVYFEIITLLNKLGWPNHCLPSEYLLRFYNVQVEAQPVRWSKLPVATKPSITNLPNTQSNFEFYFICFPSCPSFSICYYWGKVISCEQYLG